MAVITITACASQRQAIIDPAFVIRGLLAPAPAPAAASVAPRLELEILITGTGVLETLLVLTALRDGKVRAVMAQAEGQPLWAQANAAGVDLTEAASASNLKIRHSVFYNEDVVRDQINAYRSLITHVTPDDSIVLHDTAITVTATAGTSRIQVETFLDHPSGSVRSGPAGELSRHIGGWAVNTLRAFEVDIFYEDADPPYSR